MLQLFSLHQEWLKLKQQKFALFLEKICMPRAYGKPKAHLNPVIVDINNSIMDSHNSIMDSHNSIMDIRIWIQLWISIIAS